MDPVAPLESRYESASFESLFTKIPLAPFLEGTVSYTAESILPKLISPHPARVEIVELCREYRLAEAHAIRCANRALDDDFDARDDDDERYDTREWTTPQMELARCIGGLLDEVGMYDGWEHRNDATDAAKGVQDLMWCGLDPGVADAYRKAVDDGVWKRERVVYWLDLLWNGSLKAVPGYRFPFREEVVDSWIQEPHHPTLWIYNSGRRTAPSAPTPDNADHPILNTNPLLATAIQTNELTSSKLYFHACEWSKAMEVIQTPGHIPLRVYPNGQDFGAPTSASFYVNRSFKGALDWLHKNLFPRASRNANWSYAGAVLIFLINEEKLNKCDYVIDLGQSNTWQKYVARSRRDASPHRSGVRSQGFIQGAQLANVRQVQDAHTLDDAVKIARAHWEGVQYHGAIKDGLVGEIFREGLVGVVFLNQDVTE
ncbi:hypothetical protein HK104_006695 [Borealophlyctis nickersoniae]|nr:hypothetical protein HK104_006695 [Borealophlyctis nickersoniae]